MSIKDFSKREKELRESKQISMQELADLLGVSKSSINMWENAGVIPREEILKKLSSYYGVSIDYLLGNISKKEEEENRNYAQSMLVLFDNFIGKFEPSEIDKICDSIITTFGPTVSEKNNISLEDFQKYIEGINIKAKLSYKARKENESKLEEDLNKKFDDLSNE